MSIVSNLSIDLVGHTFKLERLHCLLALHQEASELLLHEDNVDTSPAAKAGLGYLMTDIIEKAILLSTDSEKMHHDSFKYFKREG